MKKLLIFGLIFTLLFSSFVLAADSSLNVSQTISSLNVSNVDSFGIPAPLSSITRFVFNVPSEEILTISYLVILLALFIFLFFLISSLMEFVPFFQGWKAWIGSLIVVLLIAFSGGVNSASQLFLGMQANFGRFSQIAFIFIAIILLIIGLSLARLLKIIRYNAGVETARQVGMNISLKPLMKKLKNEESKI